MHVQAWCEAAELRCLQVMELSTLSMHARVSSQAGAETSCSTQ